jgi:acylphosphatase
MTVIRRRVRITGTVQGVGFRFWARDEAHRLALTGWVRNATDGSVDAEVQGPEDSVEWMLRALHEGPPGSSVETVTAAELDPVADEPPFRIRR